MIEPLTVEQVRSLPSVVDVVTAGRALGMDRNKAYGMARRGEFPVRVLRLGQRYRVSTAELCSYLGIRADGEHADPAA